MPALARLPESAPAFTLHHRPGRGQRALDCWVARPASPRPDAVPLVAIHGISRAAREMAETFAAQAAAEGRTVVAPLFDAARWNGYQRAVAPRRADCALLGLLDEVSAEGVGATGRFDAVGYSGGAQFAHRFAMLYPHRLRRLSVCAAGWWTMPDAAAFPYGLSGDWGVRLAAGLDRFLALDIRVSVGAADDRPDAATRSAPALDAVQGVDRVTRARAWLAALRGEAARRGLPAPRLSLTLLPGAGHDFAACAAAGLTDLTLADTL
jgi:pimeloyl-ACP methyl ester carboxylesterase